MAWFDPLEWPGVAPLGAGPFVPEPEPDPDPAEEVAPKPGADASLTGPGTWLLDLVIGGRILRYAPRRIEVLDEAGRRYLYPAGLSDFEMRLDGLEETQGFEVLDRRVDWSALAARGSAMHRASAVLRHLAPGQVLEAARVVLSGIAENIEHGDPEALARLVGTVNGEASDILWPDPRAHINSDSWLYDVDIEEYDTDIEDAVYPTIFGYPGDRGDGGNPLGVSPALMVSHFGSAVLGTATFLICDGVCEAEQVRIFAADSQFSLTGFSGSGDFAVTQERDLLGRVVSVIKVPYTGSPIIPTAGEEYYIGWSRNPGFGGGLRRTGKPGPIHELVDVALFCLRNSGRRVDLAAQESQRDVLAPFLIDGFLTEELLLVPWFEQTLMPLFPLVRAHTSRGMFWRFVDWGAGPEQAEAHLDATDGRVRRESSLKTLTGAIRNVFRIDYQYMSRSGSFAARRTLSARAAGVLPWYENPDMVPDLRVSGSSILASSQAVYDPIEADPIEAKFVWDHATATAILRHRAIRDAFPRQSVIYSGDARTLRTLSRGSVVTVTDPQVHLDRAVGIVQSLTLSSGRLAELSLELTDPRARAT